jgi:hypothetical protein
MKNKFVMALIALTCAHAHVSAQQYVTLPASSVGGNTQAAVGIVPITPQQIDQQIKQAAQNQSALTKPWTLNFIGQSKCFSVTWSALPAALSEVPCGATGDRKFIINTDGSISSQIKRPWGAWENAGYPAYSQAMTTLPISSIDTMTFYGIFDACSVAYSVPGVTLHPSYDSAGALQGWSAVKVGEVDPGGAPPSYRGNGTNCGN